MFANGSAGFPFAPVGRLYIDLFPSTCIDPHAIIVAAAEFNGMDAGLVDNGNLHIALHWNAKNLIPFHRIFMTRFWSPALI